MKMLFLWIAGFVSICIQAQDHPGKKVELLRDKELEVMPVNESLRRFGYRNFYLTEDLNYMKTYAPMNYATAYDSLVGKRFKVIDIIPFKNSIGDDKYKLKIANETTGILYYEYSPESDVDYPFKIVGGDLPPDFYCDKIESSDDDGGTYYFSPYEDGIYFYKFKKAGKSEIYIHVAANGRDVLFTDKKGVKVKLANKKVIARPNAAISVDVSNNGSYVYQASFRLTPEEINLLKTVEIEETNVYILTEKTTASKKIKELFKCIVKQ